MKTLFKLAIVALVLNALWQVLPPYYKHVQFREAVENLALRGAQVEATVLADEVFNLAVEYGIPVEREGIHIRRERNKTFIDVTYVQSANPLPGWRVTRPMEVHAEALRF